MEVCLVINYLIFNTDIDMISCLNYEYLFIDYYVFVTFPFCASSLNLSVLLKVCTIITVQLTSCKISFKVAKKTTIDFHSDTLPAPCAYLLASIRRNGFSEPF